ncbi:hypothetical protein [Halorussus sp. AFM4]|uniref:hypothetical protein n=1 Tax=Halorussus sp. AFM4 TaxID=3421651 RepID=UPI003EBD1F69
MTEPTPKKYATPDPRYRLVEYEDSYGTVAVIQDTENDEAWIQAATTVDVEP